MANCCNDCRHRARALDEPEPGPSLLRALPYIGWPLTIGAPFVVGAALLLASGYHAGGIAVLALMAVAVSRTTDSNDFWAQIERDRAAWRERQRIASRGDGAHDRGGCGRLIGSECGRWPVDEIVAASLLRVSGLEDHYTVQDVMSDPAAFACVTEAAMVAVLRRAERRV